MVEDLIGLPMTELGKGLAWLGKPGMVLSAAAAKLPQSCPTLCDPIDGSPPGSRVPGILQARTLEWVPLPSPKLQSLGSQSQTRLNDWTELNLLGLAVHLLHVVSAGVVGMEDPLPRPLFQPHICVLGFTWHFVLLGLYVTWLFLVWQSQSEWTL